MSDRGPMSDRETALAACGDAFRDRLQRSTQVLLEGWVSAQTPADQQQLLDRFQKGLGLHKTAYARAQDTIKAVFP